MQKSVIIVAGGSGKRMGTIIPKQFLELKGIPVLMRTIKIFTDYDPDIEVVIVLPIQEVTYWDKLCIQHNFKIKHKLAIGGETRFHSVKSGLFEVTEGAVTAIHDGVRPLVSKDTLSRCFKEANEKGNGIPYINPVESVRAATGTGSRSLDRDGVMLIQTPQVFQWEQLENAYDQPYISEFTDDASVVESYGFSINLVPGNAENIKITNPLDLKIAEWLTE